MLPRLPVGLLGAREALGLTVTGTRHQLKAACCCQEVGAAPWNGHHPGGGFRCEAERLQGGKQRWRKR